MIQKNSHLFRIICLTVVAVATLSLNSCRDEEDLGSIAGFVTDANSGEPLHAVDITLSPDGLSAISGSDGRYEYQDLKPGIYTIQASKSGYISNSKRVSVVSGRSVSGDILLTPSSADMSLSVSRIDFGTGSSVENFQIINNAANGSFQWSINKEDAADWLTVSPTNGSTGAGQRSQVTLVVNRATLTTSSTTTLRINNITNGNSITLPVSVDYNSGTLVVTPTVVDFGTSASSRTITLSNSGSTSVNYEISYNCVWLTVSPTAGYLTTGGTASIALSLDRTAFSGNAETILTVRNTDDGSSISVRVTANNDGGSSSDEIVVSNGLLAYYTFDDGTANDITDNGADATLQNGASTVNKTGGGKYLNISSAQKSYLNIPYNFFSNRSRWTVSFWAKDMTAGRIFSAQYPSSNNYYSDVPALLAEQAGSLYMVTRYNNYGSPIAYNYINNSGSWHHFVIVLDGINNNANIKFYVDGTLIDNVAPSYDNVNQCTKIVFGGDKNGAYNLAPSMKVDNIRFYGRSLNATEIQTIYNNEL